VVSHLCVLASVMPSWNIGFLHNWIADFFLLAARRRDNSDPSRWPSKHPSQTPWHTAVTVAMYILRSVSCISLRVDSSCRRKESPLVLCVYSQHNGGDVLWFAWWERDVSCISLRVDSSRRRKESRICRFDTASHRWPLHRVATSIVFLMIIS
jgi:hypothetical protein